MTPAKRYMMTKKRKTTSHFSITANRKYVSSWYSKDLGMAYDISFMSLSFYQMLLPIPDDSNIWVLRAAHIAWGLVITVIGCRGQSTDWQA